VLEVSVLKNQILKNSMEQQSALRPKNGKKARSMLFNLSLTSLIDAFSILVIFLLINLTGSNNTIKLDKGMQLPTALQVNTLQMGTVVSVNKGHYFIDEKEISKDQITRKLYEIRKKLLADNTDGKDNIIIKADKKTEFASLNPIIMAGSQAGFQHFKFAVTQEATKK